MAMRAKMREAKNLVMAIVAPLDLAKMFEEKRKILMEEMVGFGGNECWVFIE